MCRHFAPGGEFGVFGPFRGVLIDYTVFFSQFCIDSITVHVSALLPGELGDFEVF